ncbi:aminopeptidase N [Streptomyces sp. NPDC048603]|uniref:aminopeptidase N n=1 Tax=Streptomyces sp. NPDC048603 TaxID=3365577 RepID=UPI003718A9D3
MPGTNLTREEAQQRAKLLTVDSYEIELDLSGAQEGGTYPSVTTVRFDSAEENAETFIDLVAPTVHEVVLNGTALDAAEVFQDSRIALKGLKAGTNELKVVADCAYTNTGEGLHRFVDPVDEQAYLYTQFEVPDARRVFASFEQPDLKASFTFTVKAPEGWTVISNSPTPEPKDNLWSFEPTPRMSTYVTALIVGPYHAVHSSYEGPNGQVVPLAIYCRPSLAEFLDADAVFEVTRQGFDWFQEKFDYAYPFAKYDQLFVPEFNAGAMENAGAVTIRDQYVFRSKVTDAAYEVRAETILHELAHMWFGDLVTMEWWNDLWLNESFATYTSIACQAYAPDSKWPHSWTTFANSMKTWAYRQDQLPSTHPIMAEIRDLDDVLVNFDGITYAKGASVLKQLVAYVGMDEFFKGVQAYFKAHAFGNTRLSDLLGALEETSGRDLTAWSKAWLETAGINILRPEIETDEHGKITSFRVRQEAPALPAGAKGEPVLRPHRIAIGFYSMDPAGGGKLLRERRVELDIAAAELTEVPELVGHHRPDVVLLNDDDLSYAKVRLDEHSLAKVTAHLGDFEASLPRALCWASAWDMTRDGELATRDYLSLVLSGIGKESDIGVVQSLHRQVKLAIDLYADPAWRETGLAAWTDATLEHLRAAEAGSDHQLAWARAFAATARTAGQLDLLAALLDGTETVEGLVVDTELRWAFLERLAATGRADEAKIAAELERDKTAAGERHAATARAALPTAEAKAAAWSSVIDSADLPNAVQEAVIGGFVQTDQRELLASYSEKYFSVLKGIWESRSHEIAQQIAVGLYPSLQVSQATLDATDAWLASAEPNAALRRLVSESRAGVERALKAQAADAAAS